MKELLRKLKNAIDGGGQIDRGNSPTEFVSYDGEQLRVRNGRVWASIAAPALCDPFVAHASTLLSSLEKLPDARISNVSDSRLTLSYPGGRAFVRCLPPSDWPLAHWRDAPAAQTPGDMQGLLEAFALLRPFISDNALHTWSMGIQSTTRELLVTDNAVLAVIQTAIVPWHMLVPVWLVDFVLSQDTSPTAIGNDGTCIGFWWPGGLEVHALLPNENFPDGAVAMAQSQGDENAWRIPDDWRKALTRLSDVSMPSTTVEIEAEIMRVIVSNVLTVEETISTPVTAPRRFNVNQLQKIVSCATQIEIDSGVAKWRKDSSTHGLIAGRV